MVARGGTSLYQILGVIDSDRGAQLNGLQKEPRTVFRFGVMFAEAAPYSSLHCALSTRSVHLRKGDFQEHVCVA